MGKQSIAAARQGFLERRKGSVDFDFAEASWIEESKRSDFVLSTGIDSLF